MTIECECIYIYLPTFLIQSTVYFEFLMFLQFSRSMWRALLSNGNLLNVFHILFTFIFKRFRSLASS